jgi:outer membrane protein OmpA-like peptidoglycan-associated protein
MTVFALAALASLAITAPLGPLPSRQHAVHVAGLCVGSAAECVAEVIADGTVTTDEAALPFVLRITFDYDSTLLTGTAKRELEAVAEVLKDPRLSGTTFIVEGHTDSKGKRRYNLALSQRRAETVTEYLATLGIHPSRLRAVGRGETEPLLAANPLAPENRRVELRLNLR